MIERNYGGNPFFFASKVFRSFRLVELHQIMRQSDPILCEALKQLRFGKLTAGVHAIFDRCVAPRPDGVLALVVTNQRASTINREELAKVGSEFVTFAAKIDGDVDERAHPTDAALELKVGARVVILRNGNDYVNGDTGKVVEIGERDVRVQLDRGHAVNVEPVEWQIREPVAEKGLDDDGNECTRVVENVVGTFKQLPVRLGWALSIHKAQGMSLERAHIDLGNGTFCHGQAYVALSRVRSLDGLTLERYLRPSDFIFDPKALGYMTVFQRLGHIEQQVRGCSFYNRTGRPFRGDERLSCCPLSKSGCPRIRPAVPAEHQHEVLSEKAHEQGRHHPRVLQAPSPWLRSA